MTARSNLQLALQTLYDNGYTYTCADDFDPTQGAGYPGAKGNILISHNGLNMFIKDSEIRTDTGWVRLLPLAPH